MPPAGARGVTRLHVPVKFEGWVRIEDGKITGIDISDEPPESRVGGGFSGFYEEDDGATDVTPEESVAALEAATFRMKDVKLVELVGEPVWEGAF